MTASVCCSVFDLDCVINHSDQHKDPGGYSHVLCDLETAAAFTTSSSPSLSLSFLFEYHSLSLPLSLSLSLSPNPTVSLSF